MRILRVPLVLALVLAASCSTLPPPVQPVVPAPWPDVTLGVFTDPHVLAPTLVTDEGAALLEQGAYQMFRESPEILETQVKRYLAERPSAVLITGDLTKEGERASHEFVARALEPLRAAGIPVLVIPGNHDVLNPLAMAYGGSGKRPVPTITPEDFARIYGDYGYSQALSRDPASLSYMAEPVKGLRVLALDSIRYEENAGKGRQVTAGRLRDASWPWIDRVLDEAAADHAAVLVLMHHGLVEKFDGQSGLFSEYLVADRLEVARRLAERGVQVVLTGHFHSLSAAEAFPGGRPILDIEGGTLSTYPLGFRRLEASGGRLRVTTGYVTDLPSWADRPGQFIAKAKAFGQGNIAEAIGGRLRRAGVSKAETDILTSAFSRAFGAVTEGDPVKPADWVWPPQGLGPAGSLVVAYLGKVPDNLWAPLAPADRSFDLPLPLPPGPASR